MAGGRILIVKLVSESNHAKITSAEEIPFFPQYSKISCFMPNNFKCVPKQV